jgi:hypothetical protein
MSDQTFILERMMKYGMQVDFARGWIRCVDGDSYISTCFNTRCVDDLAKAVQHLIYMKEWEPCK